MSTHEQTTTEPTFSVGDRVTCKIGGGKFSVTKVDGTTITIDDGFFTYVRQSYELVKQTTEPTREGGMERTAAAGSASREFRAGDVVNFPVGTGTVQGVIAMLTGDSAKIVANGTSYIRHCGYLDLVSRPVDKKFAVGDTVIVSVAGQFIRGEIAEFGGDDTVRVTSGNLSVWRFCEDLAPVADPPPFVIGGIQDDEVTDLDEVEAEDKLVGACLDAVNTLVRICDAGDLTGEHRVRINGVTWVVAVRKE